MNKIHERLEKLNARIAELEEENVRLRRLLDECRVELVEANRELSQAEMVEY